MKLLRLGTDSYHVFKIHWEEVDLGDNDYKVFAYLKAR
jgi:hypothetical protein